MNLMSINDEVEKINNILEQKFQDAKFVGINYLLKAILTVFKHNENITVSQKGKYINVFFQENKKILIFEIKKKILIGGTQTITQINLNKSFIDTNLNYDLILQECEKYKNKDFTNNKIKSKVFLDKIKTKVNLNHHDILFIVSEFDKLDFNIKQFLLKNNWDI